MTVPYDTALAARVREAAQTLRDIAALHQAPIPDLHPYTARELEVIADEIEVPF